MAWFSPKRHKKSVLDSVKPSSKSISSPRPRLIDACLGKATLSVEGSTVSKTDFSCCLGIFVFLWMLGSALSSIPGFADYIYVSNADDPGTLSVFDPANQSVLGYRIVVDDSPEHMAFNREKTKLYVTNATAPGYLSIINTLNNNFIGKIAVGDDPEHLALVPNGTKLYVSNKGSDSISVIDTVTDTVITTISLAAGAAPYYLAVTPNGEKVYVTDRGSNTVSIIDVATNSLTSQSPLTVGNRPYYLVITSDGSEVYVTNNTDGTVSVINTASDTVSDTLTVETSPKYLALTPDCSKVFVTNTGSDSVSQIVTATKAVTTFAAGTDPEYLGISPDGQTLYVTNVLIGGHGIVRIFSTTTHLEIADHVHVGNSPSFLLISPDGSQVFVANQTGSTVSIINTTINKSTRLLSVGDNPYNLIYLPLPATPGNFQGKQVVVKLPSMKARKNILSWNPVSYVVPVQYKIYRNDVLITVIGSEGPYTYVDNKPQCIPKVSYGISSIDGYGRESPIQTIYLP